MKNLKSHVHSLLFKNYLYQVLVWEYNRYILEIRNVDFKINRILLCIYKMEDLKYYDINELLIMYKSYELNYSNLKRLKMK